MFRDRGVLLGWWESVDFSLLAGVLSSMTVGVMGALICLGSTCSFSVGGFGGRGVGMGGRL